MKKVFVFVMTVTSTALLLLLVILPTTTVFAQGIEVPICTHPAGQYSPAIWGSRIVWTDYRNNAGDDNNDIYMYDLNTGQETRITTAPQHQGEPAIWENRIVWSDYRNEPENSDIYMYDILAGIETSVCTDPQRQSTPSLWGDRIVWSDFRNNTGLTDTYMYDLFTKTEGLFRTATGEPHVWQSRVVWEDLRDGYHGIYMTDLSTGIETPICTGPGQQAGRPRIWGDKIIWSDWRSGTYLETYMYNLSTSEEKKIAEGYNPDIWEHLVAYLRNCGVDCSNIYVYDINTGIETQIPNTAKAGPPRINNNRIVWEDHRNGNSDIYMYEIYPPVPEPLEVTINIRPQGDANRINLRSNGKVAVAILSTPDFDAPSQVDQGSLTFGATGDEQSLISCKRKPKDVNHDGVEDDLVCHFSIQLAGFQCGDTEGILKGLTMEGKLIEGKDSVNIVKCK